MNPQREPSGHQSHALRRGLQLLEAVAAIGPGATAQQIAAHTTIPRATTYKLLNLLVADGYLVRIGDLSGFALGMRIRQLAVPDNAVDTHNSRVLEEQRQTVRHGLFLIGFDGISLLLLDADPDRELVGEAEMCAHPHATAAGKLLLAASESRVTTSAPLPGLTPRTIRSPAALAVELDRIERSEIATEIDESRPGRSAIAVPVRDGAQRITAALTLIGATGRLRVQDPETIQLLRRAASRLVVESALTPTKIQS